MCCIEALAKRQKIVSRAAAVQKACAAQVLCVGFQALAVLCVGLYPFLQWMELCNIVLQFVNDIFFIIFCRAHIFMTCHVLHFSKVVLFQPVSDY